MFRKLLAVIIFLAITYPLMNGAMILGAVNQWLFDRQFYVELLDDPALYDLVLSQDSPIFFSRNDSETWDGIPVQALVPALREVVTVDYLRGEVNAIVDEFFAVLDGDDRTFDIAWNLVPLKETLRNDPEKSRFITTYVANLPVCTNTQTTNATPLPICRPSDLTPSQAEAVLSDRLPQFLDTLPDATAYSETFPEGADMVFSLLRRGEIAIYIGLFATGLWVLTALIGARTMRGRLLWLSLTLLLVSIPLLFFGLGMTAFPEAGTWMANEFSQTNIAVQTSMIDALQVVIGRIASSFISVAGIATLIGIGLFIWGLRTAVYKEDENMPWSVDPEKTKLISN